MLLSHHLKNRDTFKGKRAIKYTINVSVTGTLHKWQNHNSFTLLKLNKGNLKVVSMNRPLLLRLNYFKTIVATESKIEKILAHYCNTNDQHKQNLSDQTGA